MSDPTKRGNKIVSATVDGTAVGCCVAWAFKFSRELHGQPNEDSVYNDAQIETMRSQTVNLSFLHGMPGVVDSKAIVITERMGNGATRAFSLGNFCTTDLGGSHGEGGLTLLDAGFISIGTTTVPTAG